MTLILEARTKSTESCLLICVVVKPVGRWEWSLTWHSLSAYIFGLHLIPKSWQGQVYCLAVAKTIH